MNVLQGKSRDVVRRELMRTVNMSISLPVVTACIV